MAEQLLESCLGSLKKIATFFSNTMAEQPTKQHTTNLKDYSGIEIYQGHSKTRLKGSWCTETVDSA